MLLESPMKKAIELGHNPEGYQELANQLNKIREQITPEMQSILSQYETDKQVREIIQSSIPKEGSYHRGSLVSIVSASKGEKPNSRIAAAVELFYWATAWLDDIADKNTLRQGTESIRKTSGDTIAMYASNALYGIVFRAIADELKEPKKLSKVVNLLARNFHIINRGQTIDALMTTHSLESVSVADYISLIEETTGVDVASNLGIGAVLAEIDQETFDNVYKFGLNLGALAQIRDDVLDYCNTKDEKGDYVIGKLPFRDVETGKKRLPLLLTQNTKLRSLPNEVYDRIEEDFVKPRREKAKNYLHSADISEESKETLESILNYWSDIRLFQKLSSNE